MNEDNNSNNKNLNFVKDPGTDSSTYNIKNKKKKKKKKKLKSTINNNQS